MIDHSHVTLRVFLFRLFVSKVIIMTSYAHRSQILPWGMSLVATEFLLFCLTLRAQDVRPSTFESDVIPILKANCLMCHGATGPQAGLDLGSRDSILKGGKSGRAIVPGSSDQS